VQMIRPVSIDSWPWTRSTITAIGEINAAKRNREVITPRFKTLIYPIPLK
jgi:hypothetical protein